MKGNDMAITNERLDRVVKALARAASRDFAYRIQFDGTEDSDGFLEIEVGLNLLLEVLETATRENQEHLAEIEQKNREIAERQTMALRELATPIMAVADHILTLPVIGAVDTERSATMMDALLERVVADQASHVIVDITGVSMLDTRTADHFLRMAKAVRLLGAECYLTGISSGIAQTMAELGIDTGTVRTMRSMSDALKAAQKALAEAQGAQSPT